jgi:hypothetical protein
MYLIRFVVSVVIGYFLKKRVQILSFRLPGYKVKLLLLVVVVRWVQNFVGGLAVIVERLSQA